MAKKKKNNMFDEVVVDQVEYVEEVSDAVVDLEEKIEMEAPFIVEEAPKKECKKGGTATVMVMVNSIRYEGVIVRRGEHLKMCKEAAKAAAAAKRCIIL